MKKFVLDLTVSGVERISEKYALVRLTGEAPLPAMLPGQFVEVRVDGSPSTFLRRPISINFVDRERTPLDRDGRPDFEALEALDLELVNEQISALLAGEEVDVPKFDFLTGKRTKGRKMRLAPNELLVIEGIHGLNSRLTQSVSADKKYKIFICPLTGTNIDFHNRLGTTDTRLIRRLVRDARTRGHSAEATLKQWPSVVRGSFRHIFPYQDNADAIFNTALAYEIPVLKGYVVPLLKTVPEDSPVYGEAQRLLAMLHFVPVIPSDDVPNLSIIREFIGGSCFE